MNLEFSGQIFEKYSIPDLTKTRWIADELFDADGQRHRHDEAVLGAFRKFTKAPKTDTSEDSI